MTIAPSSVLPLVALLATTAAAQSVVLPAGAATTPPNPSPPNVSLSSFLFDGNGTHCELVYPTGDVGQASALWQAMAVRRPATGTTPNPAMTMNATIVMSVSPLAYSGVSSTFAANHGPAPVTVFSGTLSLPARAQPASWPAPWEVLPFTTPFAFQSAAGQSLVIEITETNLSPSAPWNVEVDYPDVGTRQDNDTTVVSTCRFGNGVTNTSITFNKPMLGNDWWVSYLSLPPNLKGIGVLGASGIGGSWAGMMLPIDLTAYGAPGCTWNVSVDITVPLINSSSNVYTWPVLRIPSDPALAGETFYEQAALLDPSANALGVGTTRSSKWTIGIDPGARASFIDAFLPFSAGNPNGRFHGRTGVSIRLDP